ncbi:MAG: 3-phosphoshikimate 1-carboxyvinyltransferase [bacterium]
MNKLTVQPAENIKKEIRVPGDKSISHRAIMIGSLADGETNISGFLPSADCLATIDCFRQLGITIEQNGSDVIVHGKGLTGLSRPKKTLHVGNSGTTIRLLSGILAGQPFSSEITGDASIQKRPMGRIVKPLSLMGARIKGQEKEGNVYAPLTITGGKLKAVQYELPVASAQVKSAVLLAGLFAKGKTSVIEKIQSRDHTERMLEYFEAGQTGFAGKELDIPGDISSAAFFMVLGLIVPGAEITIDNVGLNPTRTGIIDVLHRMGAQLEVSDEQIISGEPRGRLKVRSPSTSLGINSELKAVKIDGEIIPRIIDEIPIIAVAATQAKGITEIRGAKELRVKESDRIATISAELRKMGAKIEELDDGMIIEGPTKLKGTTVKSYGDHRVAMALAVAAKIASGETIIDDTVCIDTSFPGFAKLL